MKTWLKKIIVIAPEVIVSLVYLRLLYQESYSEASFKRIAGLVLSVLLLYAWVIFASIRKNQTNFFQVLV